MIISVFQAIEKAAQLLKEENVKWSRDMPLYGKASIPLLASPKCLNSLVFYLRDFVKCLPL